MVTSSERVQPPQVHQQLLVLVAAAGFAGHPPGTLTAMFGIEMPDWLTSWIHCWTSGESVGGGVSSAGYLLELKFETSDDKKKKRY